MKRLSFPIVATLFTLLLSAAGCRSDSVESASMLESTPDPSRSAWTPMEIVNQRMSAFNAHDLPGLLELYSDSIEIFTYPDSSLGEGKDHLRWVFEPMFDKGVVNVAVHDQFEIDSYVVNHETVDYGDKVTRYVSIYEVSAGLIQSVSFVRD